MTTNLLIAENTQEQQFTVDSHITESTCKLLFPTIVETQGTSISISEAGEILLEPGNTFTIEANAKTNETDLGSMVVVTEDGSIISNMVTIGETVLSTISVSDETFKIYIAIYGKETDGTFLFPSSILESFVTIKTI